MLYAKNASKIVVNLFFKSLAIFKNSSYYMGMKGLTKQNTCLENSGILEKGENQIMVEIKSKPMSKANWKRSLKSYQKRLDDIVMDKVDLKDNAKALKRVVNRERRLNDEMDTFFAENHEKGKKVRAVSSRLEQAVLSSLDGNDKDYLVKQVAQMREIGNEITKYCVDNGITTIKTKTGGDTFSCNPTCSVKWDNDKEIEQVFLDSQE